MNVEILNQNNTTISTRSNLSSSCFNSDSSALKQVLGLQGKYPDSYINLQLDNNVDGIICYKNNPAQPNWKIALPESMVVDTIKWFHQVMQHPGEKRLHKMLN
jgi:hypothetical protein